MEDPDSDLDVPEELREEGIWENFISSLVSYLDFTKNALENNDIPNMELAIIRLDLFGFPSNTTNIITTKRPYEKIHRQCYFQL